MSDVVEAFRSPKDPNASILKEPRGPRIYRMLAVIGIVVMLIGLLLPATRSARPAAYRMQCANNLKQIALALQNYQDVYGTLPPACTANADGMPMHSWRVLILPFLEQDGLYKKYRFDEPWNGPNNSRLAAEIPTVYRCPSFSPQGDRRARPTDREVLTQYVVLCDASMPFPGSRAMRMGQYNDGASDTLMVAELDAECVPWMAPRDIDLAGFARVLSRNDRRRQHTGGLHVAMSDGHVNFLRHNTEYEMLQRLVTASGGEAPQDY